jgi:Zn-dependent protease/CBS domain-containing protein
LKSHIKLGRIRGVELGLHYSWLIIAVLIVISLGARFRYSNPDWSTVVVWVTAVATGMLFFACLFAHELAHAMVAKARGLPIRRITLFLLGGMAQIEREAQDAATEFWVAVVGPAASVALGLFCLALARVLFGWQWWSSAQTPAAALLTWLGYINLLLAAFNLIPGFPMDGGRVLRALIWWKTNNADKATRVATRVGQVVGWIFVVWGVFRLFTGFGLGGLWIALIGWFLIQAATGTRMQSKATALLRGLTVEEIMWRDCARVDAAADVDSFVNSQLLRGQQRCYLVMDGGALVGLVSQNDVRKRERALWPHTMLRDIMRPLSSVEKVTPETPLKDALERMSQENAGELLVVSNGYLQGVVSREAILHVLEMRAELKAA